MRTTPLTVAALATLALTVACSSAPILRQDDRPLGNVTSAPRECGLISANTITLATGLKKYTVYGTKMDKGQRFASCSVHEESEKEDRRGLLIEVFDPSSDSAEDLENTRTTNQGKDLPAALGPGFTARRKNDKNQTIALVYGWTPDYKRLLTVSIVEGAPGRDSLADATEIFRQLKPILLDQPK